VQQAVNNLIKLGGEENSRKGQMHSHQFGRKILDKRPRFMNPRSLFATSPAIRLYDWWAGPAYVYDSFWTWDTFVFRCCVWYLYYSKVFIFSRGFNLEYYCPIVFSVDS